MYDFCVIGGGIVGLATAVSLQDAFPGCELVVVEKEADVGRHQTGHNSGVIHAGIYYAPGSLKARLCREGAAATKAFCTEHGIPFETCGKLLVATTPLEVERMDDLQDAGRRRTASSASASTPPSWWRGSRTSPASARCSCRRPASSTTSWCAPPCAGWWWSEAGRSS